MSAVIALASRKANQVFMLSDAAVYSREGILLDLRRKVQVSERAPIAVGFRGNALWGEFVSRHVMEVIEDEGFDKGLRSVEADLLPRWGARADNNDAIEVTIAGLSETRGACIVVFQTAPNMGMEPLRLYDETERGWLGMNTSSNNEFGWETGCRRALPGDTAESYHRDNGVTLMEYFRRTETQGRVSKNTGRTKTGYSIGGWVDFTIVDERGARVEKIHSWAEDKIGEKIDPFAGQNITPITAGMNRQQRRAAARKGSRAA